MTHPSPANKIVWARRQVLLETCPTGYVTADSQVLVEDFLVRRRMRAFDFEELTARQVEAFVILEQELAGELNNGGNSGRRSS